MRGYSRRAVLWSRVSGWLFKRQEGGGKPRIHMRHGIRTTSLLRYTATRGMRKDYLLVQAFLSACPSYMVVVPLSGCLLRGAGDG